jgi:hypothetical protein
MNFKTTIVLIVLLAFAGGALWFVNSREAKDASSTDTSAKNAQKIFSIADSDVIKIDVASAEGKKLVLDKSGGKWKLLEPVSAPAEAFEVDSLVRSITGLESHGDVEKSTADSKSTGLATPRYTIELTGKNGEKQTLLVGDKLAVGDNLYVSRKDTNKSAVVSADLQEKLDKPASDYRDKKLVTDYSTAGIGQITIARPDGKMVLVKKGEEWKITEPVEMPAEKTEVDDIVFGLTGLRAAEFVSENPTDAPMYELDRPRVIATLGPPPATTLPVGIAAPTSQPAATSQPAPVVIKFGRYDDILKKNVLVMTSQSQAIAKVPATILDTIRKTPLDLRDKRVLDIDPSQVSAITVNQDIAATTKPTSKPAVQKEIVIKRHKEVAATRVTQPATRQAATSSPSTTRVAATQPAPATQPAAKWEIAGEAKRANDGKVDSLLNQLHPLRTRKYLEKAPPTTKPAGTYVVKITTEGPGGTPVNHYELKLVDPGSTGDCVGTYNGLTFEADRALIQNVGRDYFESSKPPGVGNEAEQPSPPQSFDPTGQ